MSRFTRYIVAELLKVFSITLAAMTLLMILVGVAHEAMRQGLGPSAVLQLIPYVLPNALLFAVPGTVLFAVCAVYGRISASNEIVAIKSLGISPSSVVVPALVLAFVLSLFTVWLNDISVSWGRKGMYRVVIRSVEQSIYGVLRSKKAHRTQRFAINVQGVEDRFLIHPTVQVFGSADQEPITLAARKAELRSDYANDTLIVIMYDGEMEVGERTTLVFDRFEQGIPLPEVIRKGVDSTRPSNLPLRSMAAERVEQAKQIERLEQKLAAQASMQMVLGEFEELTSGSWTGHHYELDHARERQFRLRTEPWRRWANGFSCLFFVMVGAPLAIRLRNADLWTSFALCFLPILIIYYPLLIFGVDRAKSGFLPPYAVWIGNAILAIVGCLMLRRVVRG